MANFRRIRALRNRLANMKETESRQFGMQAYIRLISGKYTYGDSIKVGTVRKNGPTCGTASCLAGETVIAFASPESRLKVTVGRCLSIDGFSSSDIHHQAERLLNLSSAEADHMFLGFWTVTTLTRITRRQALIYLDKVIAAKDVMVYLSKKAEQEAW